MKKKTLIGRGREMPDSNRIHLVKTHIACTYTQNNEFDLAHWASSH